MKNTDIINRLWFDLGSPLWTLIWAIIFVAIGYYIRGGC